MCVNARAPFMALPAHPCLTSRTLDHCIRSAQLASSALPRILTVSAYCGLASSAGDDENYILAAGTRQGSDENSTDGIVDGHAYSVLHVVNDACGTGIDLIKMRNPHGKNEISNGCEPQTLVPVGSVLILASCPSLFPS